MKLNYISFQLYIPKYIVKIDKWTLNIKQLNINHKQFTYVSELIYTLVINRIYIIR